MQNKQWVRRVAGLTMVAGFSAAIAGCGTTAQATQPHAKVLALVNGHKITQTDWQSAVNATEMIQGAALPSGKTAEKSQVQQLAQQMVVEQWALKHHLTTPQQAASQAKTFVNQTLMSSLGGKSGLGKALAQHHLTAAELQQFLTQQMELEAAFTKQTASITSLPKGTGQQFYNTHHSLFVSPKQAQVRMILVKTNSLAQKLLGEIKKGASFSALAKKYSQDPTSRANGGSLGLVPLGSQSGFVPGFVKVMDSLKPGQYGIAHTRYGYHIIQVQKIVPPSLQPYSTVKSQIQQNLLQSKKNQVFQTFLKKLQAGAHIKLYV